MSDQQRARSTLEIGIVSLIWPPDYPRPARASADPAWAADLGLDELVRALATTQRYVTAIKQALTALTADPVVIAWRQAALNDFLQNPALVERITDLLPRLTDLRQSKAMLGHRKRALLLETADRLAELELYLETVQDLHKVLQAASLKSAALSGLRDNLHAIIDDSNFKALREELPELQKPLQNLASLTVGINLDQQLQPVSVVLLAINDRRFTEPRSLLSRLLGTRTSEEDDSGIAPMHHVPPEAEHRPLSPLFQDLEKIVIQVAGPVARSLNRYVRISSAPLAGLEDELAFYVAAVRLIQSLQARGVAFCQPEIAPADERISHIDGLVNVNLALRGQAAMVPNDAALDEQGRIAILTGPNSGGKTTYLQAVGLAHVLFQAGLFVPARRARISPVDALFTHFPALETQQQGRLSEEAVRLRHVCLNTTAHSLVLMNESLSSTTASEALYLAQDLLSGLRAIGVRGIFATHLVELAEHIREIEAAVDGPSAVYSLVAGVRFEGDSAVPTFSITRGLPLGRGYAQEIARRHGISLEQILAARAERDGKESP